MLMEHFNSETAKWAFRTPTEDTQAAKAGVDKVQEKKEEGGVPVLPVEPELSEEQIEELEVQFGSGLIEEVIDQGWAELRLVGDMEEARVWEPLEVLPEEGQWEGFERTP